MKPLAPVTTTWRLCGRDDIIANDSYTRDA
jgi:hypothetical protein